MPSLGEALSGELQNSAFTIDEKQRTLKHLNVLRYTCTLEVSKIQNRRDKLSKRRCNLRRMEMEIKEAATSNKRQHEGLLGHWPCWGEVHVYVLKMC